MQQRTTGAFQNLVNTQVQKKMLDIQLYIANSESTDSEIHTVCSFGLTDDGSSYFLIQNCYSLTGVSLLINRFYPEIEHTQGQLIHDCVFYKRLKAPVLPHNSG